jgi:hypothetical protein
MKSYKLIGPDGKSNGPFYQGLRAPALTVNALGSPSAWDDGGNRNRSGPAFTVNAFPVCVA